MGADENFISLHASNGSSTCKADNGLCNDEVGLSITASQPSSGNSNNGCQTAPKKNTISHRMDGTSIAGVKRLRETNDDQSQSVFVKYNSLSRKSKKKLEDLLHHWSQWHAQECSILEDSNELLESGEETYYPALQVGPHKSSPVTFIMDSQVRKKQRSDAISLNGDAAPLYDREYSMILTSADGASHPEGLKVLDAFRCFNCGSYNHSLKECSKPRDATAVKNARQQHQAKNGHSTGPRVLTRYYQSSPGGKYDGLKPGVLAAETRHLLGLGELDPPPWLNRMREIGYPPGYYDLPDEDKPSGIKIYADNENGEQDGECLKLENINLINKMTVDFPGINASIPANADQRKWDSISLTPTVNSYIRQSEYRSPSYSAFNNSVYPPNQIWTGEVPGHNFGISPTMPSNSTNYNYYPEHDNSLRQTFRLFESKQKISSNSTNYNHHPELNNSLARTLSYYSSMQRQSSYSFLPHLSPYSYRPPS